jgi:hypothetical protein
MAPSMLALHQKKNPCSCSPVETQTGEDWAGSMCKGSAVGFHANSLILHQKHVVVQLPAQQQVWHMTILPFTK